MKKFKDIIKGKKILVTGGTGFIGSEIVRKLLQYDVGVVRVLSNDEHNMFLLREELGTGLNLRYLVGDVRDPKRLEMATENIDIIYHAAALKHVPLCEYNPFEAVQTNILGTKNIIDAAFYNNVERVITISTDKAVNPLNTMGATKLIAEKLTVDADGCKGKKRTTFACVRFGNVAFSRGSVIPLFEDQIMNQKKVTITDPNMTRFIMSLSDTIDLVFEATAMMVGGEIFVLKMPTVKLGDLTDVIIEEYAEKYNHKTKEIEKETIGPRLGEKMYEELMTDIETQSAYETEKMLILPSQIKVKNKVVSIKDYNGAKKSKMLRYSSDDAKALTKKQIKELLFK